MVLFCIQQGKTEDQPSSRASPLEKSVYSVLPLYLFVGLRQMGRSITENYSIFRDKISDINCGPLSVLLDMGSACVTTMLDRNAIFSRM